MDLLKKVSKERPVVTETVAGDIASAPAFPLFKNTISRVITPVNNKKKTSKPTIKLVDVISNLQESMSAADVIAKLKNYTNPRTHDRNDIRVFGLEDASGNIVRVTIKADQTKDFEYNLQMILNDNTPSNNKEIAEILFQLKDSFDILDIEWPTVEEDEEVEQRLVDDSDELNDEGPSELSDVDLDIDSTVVEPADSDTGDVKSLLAQLIDTLKADANARAQEAQARAAEAKARQQDISTQHILAKVKQEEQILDMEADIKSRKEQERETKRLAQLAKWKHDIAKEQGDEDEEHWEIPGPRDIPSIDIEIEQNEQKLAKKAEDDYDKLDQLSREFEGAFDATEDITDDSNVDVDSIADLDDSNVDDTDRVTPSDVARKLLKGNI